MPPPPKSNLIDSRQAPIGYGQKRVDPIADLSDTSVQECPEKRKENGISQEYQLILT